jgi:hypothetical protein
MAFERKEIKIPINSMKILHPDGDLVRSQMLRTADTTGRIGKQNLYEEPEDVIEHYKSVGFDIVDEMKKRDTDLLWVRARAIDADVINENGDYFSWVEITKEREIQSDRDKKKVAAYKSFEGVPVYTNHENGDISKAKGKVVFAELDEENKCVWCTFYVDMAAYGDIARSIQIGTISDVSMGCFPVGTLVMTGNGYKNIEDIVPNELLVDGKGNLTKICNKQEVNYTGPLVEIMIEGGPVIRCTPNHPLFRFKKQDECLCGCGAKLETTIQKKKNLTKRFKNGHHQNIYNSMVIYSSEDIEKINQIREKKGEYATEAVEAGDLLVGDYLITPIGGEIIDSKINIDLARLLGYFLAEGCSSYDKKGNLSRIEFCFSLEEKDTLAREVIEIIKNNFNITPCIQIRNDNSHNCYVVYTSNKEIMNFLVNNCGRYSYKKELNNNLLFENEEFQKNLIGAWLSGDGYLRTLPSENEPSTINGCSVSRRLIEQISFMLNRLGIYHTISTKIDGKYAKLDEGRLFPKDFKGIDNCRVVYDLSISSAYAREIFEYCEFRQKNFRFSQQHGHRNTDKYLMRKISNISYVDYDGPVYNFEVESDEHDYMVDGIIAKNCQVEYSECSICGNKAEKESGWCDHLKNRKGKKFSGVIDKGKRKGQKVTDEVVYEENHDLKFIELSIVSDGAFANCEIDKVLPHQEVITYADKLRRTASNISSLVDQNIQGIMQRRATTTSLELAHYLDESKEILGKIDVFSGAVIQNMHKTAGMEKTAFSILDTLNDVLNKVESVIINLLSRKDNIDLTHVAKLSKAMADIQQEVSDMIDDGIGTLSEAATLPPGNEGGLGQPDQSQQIAAPNDYTTAGDVGRAMGQEAPAQPLQTQPVANVLGNAVNNVPFQVSPALEPPGFLQTVSAGIEKKWNKFSQNLNNANVRLGSILDSLDIKSEETFESTIQEGGVSMKSLNERVASAIMNKMATVVEQPIIASRDNGRYKVIISDKTDEEILGYYNDKKTDWEPTTLNSDDADAIRENRIASVTDKLMNEFVGFVKTAAVSVQTPSDVQEEQISKKRSGNPEDVQEVQIGDKRKGNPEDVQEEQISAVRTGNPTDVREVQLSEDSATVWGRKGNPEDVQEEQLGDVRKGEDVRVHEHRLESRRSKSANPVHVAEAAQTALAHMVVEARVSPSEAIEFAEKFATDHKLTDVAAFMNEKDYKKRLATRERAELGLDKPALKAIDVSFNERIADIFIENEDISPKNIKDALKIIAEAPRGDMKKVITKIANNNPQNIILSSDDEKSQEDLIRGAVYASISEVSDQPLDRSHLKVALFAVAETANETGATPEEIFEVIDGIEDNQEALMSIETERLPNSVASRIRNKERKEYWGKQASTEDIGLEDIKTSLFASLADYAEALESNDKKEMPSHLIWQVAKKLAASGENGKILVNAAIQARNDNVKEAASMSDRTDTVREIRMSMDEIPNADPSSDEFADTVRDYSIAFLQNKGYRVDPETFNFTRLSVNNDTREVVATIQSTIVKEFGDEPIEMNAPETPEFNAGVESGVEGGEVGGIDETFMTPMAKANRKERREALIREAQAAPPPGGGGGMGDVGGVGAPGAPPSDAMGGPGLSALLGPEGAEDEDTNLDSMAAPGDIKPIGSICPACGSTNVDLAVGRGECGDCHTKFDIKISLDNIVTPDETADQPGAETAPEGLGAALAPPGPPAAGPAGGAPPPGPAAPMGGAPMGGGMPMAASVSWYGTPEQFVKLAKHKIEGLTDEQIAGPKPPGTVCIACGNKQVHRAKSDYYCDKCGTIGKINVTASKKHDDKLIFTVSYLLPPLSE